MSKFWRTLRAKRANQQVRNRPKQRRLTLEPLEERLTPALFFPQIANLAVVQTHSPAAVAPTQADSFLIQVTNKGPASVSTINLIDKVPAALQSPTFTPSVGSYNSVSGAWSFPSLLATNQTATLTLTGTPAANAVGSLVNTVTVMPPAGVTDPILSNNTSTDVQPLNSNIADLAVTLTDNGSTVPGNTIGYTLVVQNNGPKDVTGTTVVDAFPDALSNVSWTATASSGSSVAASGMGNINTSVSLKWHGSASFTITGTIAATLIGTLANSASVTPPTGFFDPNTSNNSATDSVTLTPQGDLSVTKENNLPTGTVDAGGQVVYTITVSNAGPSAVTGAAVQDAIPAGLTGVTWTATASNGSSIAAASGSDNIDTTVSLLPGGTATFTVTVTAVSTFSGEVDNSATVTVPSGFTDANTANNNGTDTLFVLGVSDLSITKTDSTADGTTAPGAQVIYTVMVTNHGPFDVTGADVEDALPSELTNVSWTATASAGSSVFATSGTGDISTTVDLLNGGTTTFTITATVDSSVATGTAVANTASVFAPFDRDDQNLADNLATDVMTIRPPRNFIIFVADGLRGSAVDAFLQSTDALRSVEQNGVSFANSHAIFPTFTTPNGAAIATGHYPGDTGDFSNTIFTGFGVASNNGSPVPFIENDPILGDIDEHFGGNFLDEESLLQFARSVGYNTAAVGKLGPTAIQDVSQVNRSNGAYVNNPPQTVIIDDSTFSATGVPVSSTIVSALQAAGLPTTGALSSLRNQPSGTNTTAGTSNVNDVQQQYFTDAITKAILPTFESGSTVNPFGLVYWSRDPDGTQHNNGDSLNSLTPGINGPTSQASIKNASNNLQQLLDYLRNTGDPNNPGHKLIDNTDVFVTADHGFGTITKSNLDTTNTAKISDYASTQTYFTISVNSNTGATSGLRQDVNSGFLPPGFLAIDIHQALFPSLPMFDPDATLNISRDATTGQVTGGKFVPVDETLRLDNPANVVIVKDTVTNTFKLGCEQHPINGNAIITVDPSGSVLDFNQAKVIVAANGGSDLIYVPDHDPTTVQKIVDFLSKQDYTSGLFVDTDTYGNVPGALSLKDINLSGSTSLPKPAIVINFRSFSSNLNDANDTMSGIEVADSGLQQGQGMHGTFGRQDTFNFMAAIGPDFKTSFVDNTPVSNADVAPTLAQVLGFDIPSNGSLMGRAATESLVNGPASLPTTTFTTTSDPAANGQTTILKGQTAGGETYFDVAGFDNRSIGLNSATPTPSAAPNVILVSLDGATPRILDPFIAANPNSALAQLKNVGIEAQQNTTIDPSLTAPGHVAIVTGSIASSNDVVGNAFRLIDTPFNNGSTVSGFSAPIGGYGIDGPVDSAVNTATPVWQGILASGQKVVAATFPGADGLNVTVPGLPNSPIIQSAAERTTTFTVPYGTFGGSSAAGFVLSASNFAEDNGSIGVVNGKTVTQQLGAAGHASFSSVLVTRAPFETINSTIGGGGPAGGYQLMAAALDTTNDGVQNYDTLVVFERSIGIRSGPFNNLITGPAYLTNNGKDQPFYLEGSNNRVGTGFFVSKFDPLFWTTDAANSDTIHLARYASNFIPRNLPVIQDVDNVNNNVGFWSYSHDFRIVERLTPSFAPFSDDELQAIDNAATRRFVDYQARLGVFSMQQTPGAALGMVYIEEPDGLEHQYLLTDPRQAVDFTNPNSIGTAVGGTTNFATDPKVAQYAANIQSAYQYANGTVQQILDLVGTDANGVPRSDVIVVSDHGFDPFHTAVDMSNLVTNTILPAVNSALTSAGLATISSSDIRAITTGPAVNIYLNLDMRPNGVAGTVSKAQYVVAVPAIANALKGLKDTNTTYNPAGAVALFDIVRGRPLGTGVNDPNLGRLTDDLVGQDSGDVFAILKTGYNFDGSQGTAFVVRKGDTATTALASGLMSDTATSLTVTGTVTPGAQNSAFPTSTPFTIQIDSEQLTVTAVNGNTWTVTRGSNGTKPASHLSDALVFNRFQSAFQVPNFYGAHGYDPSLPDMSAIFLAAGPDFGHGTLGSVRNIDIAPTIDQILGVTPAATVQGKALPRGIAPTAAADSFNVAKDSSNNALNLLGNDSANIAGGKLGLVLVNGQPITGTGVNADGSVNRQIKTAHGTLTVSQDGTKVSYTPDAGFTGQDAFTYNASNAVQIATLPRMQIGTVNGVPIYDGFGSALAAVPGSSTDFYSMTDRGPNVDGPNGSKVFVLPSFTPQIGRFRINPDGTVTQVGTILLKDQNGNPRTGLPNPSNAGGTGETAIDQNGNPLASDQKGIDSEGLVALPDGTFWVSDEYGPYLTHFDANGNTLAQYGPFSASVPGLTIQPGLPQVLKNRIPNKGMEGLTVTPDGKTLVGMMQSPLANGVSTSDAGKSSLLRIVTFSLDPVTFGQTKQYAYVLNDPSAGVSEIAAVSNTEFLVDERDGKFPGDTAGGASKIKQIYRINLADATDISDPANSAGGLSIGGKTLEQLTNKQVRDQTQATLRANGIIPVAKALTVDLLAEANNLGVLGTLYDHDKVEGLSLINGGRTLVLSNDDDFGVNSTGNSTPPFATSKALPNLPATPADFAQFLFIDLASLPAKQAHATVTIYVQ